MNQKNTLENLLTSAPAGSEIHTILEPGAVVTEAFWPSEKQIRKIHVIRIGGAGMSAVARLALDLGYEVTGSESQDGQFLEPLREKGARIQVGFDAENLEIETDLVVVSTAVRADNPEIIKAHEQNVPVIHRAAALAGLLDGHEIVAVAGTHGKTTTTSMAALALRSAGTDPAWAVGAAVAQLGANSGLGSKPHIPGTTLEEEGSAGKKLAVVEADESDGSFLAFAPKAIVLTNFEADHLDFHQNEANLQAVFTVFISRLQEAGNDAQSAGVLVACADDPGSWQLSLKAKEMGIKTLTYGEAENADWQIIADNSTSAGAEVTVRRPNGKVFNLQLQVPGRHNVLNALGALIATKHLGFKVKELLPGLAAFTGAQRRFQLVGESEGIQVIDDYAHHPKEVQAALGAARERAADKPVVAVFQPHLFSRTKAFLPEFAESLQSADQIFILPIYAAREDFDPNIKSEDLVAAIQELGSNASLVEFESAPEQIASQIAPNSLVMMMGAGDIVELSEPLLAKISAQNAAGAGK